MYLMVTKHSTNEIQEAVSYLVSALPYPIEWYNTLEDKQILAMKREHLKKLVKAAIAKDKEEVDRRMGKHLLGTYRLVCINTCSMRFVYTTPEGKEIHGLIATYKTKGYDLCKDVLLFGDDYHLAWENGSARTLSRSLLISKILSTSRDDAKKMVDGIHKLKRAR